MSAPAHRDPAARIRLGAVLAAVAVLWPLFRAAEVQPAVLFDGANVRVIGAFLAGFLPLASDAEFLSILGRATLETLALNKLDDRFTASPVAVGRDLFLRGAKFLYALRETAEDGAKPGP